MTNLKHAVPVQASTPSFVDLRQFARDQTLGIAASSVAGEDRFLSHRRLLDWVPGGPVTAGAITLEAGSGAVSSMPRDEFIIVSEGSLSLTQQDTTLTLTAGQSAVIQDGAAFAWSAQGPVSIIFLRYNRSVSGKGAIVPVQQNPQLGPSKGGPLGDLLLTAPPVCRNFTDYSSADGELTVGTWDSTPYHRRAMYFRHCELMHLLEGSVTFVDEVGRRGTFSQGDIFLIEQTAQCSWESRNHVAKVYAIYRPPA